MYFLNVLILSVAKIFSIMSLRTTLNRFDFVGTRSRSRRMAIVGYNLIKCVVQQRTLSTLFIFIFLWKRDINDVIVHLTISDVNESKATCMFRNR
jgi:hypothetical protein